MDYLKRYPKMAYASLGLLVAASLLMWADWITIDRSSVLGSLIQWVSNMGSGISFADGRLVARELADLSKQVSSLFGGVLGNGAKNAFDLLRVLSIAYIVLFVGTIAAVGYCIYARLRWEAGLREASYFMFFAADIGVMYLLVNTLNKVSDGTFKMGIWGFVALGCALLSEILWEEVSFNTPKPGTKEWDRRMALIRGDKEG